MNAMIAIFIVCAVMSSCLGASVNILNMDKLQFIGENFSLKLVNNSAGRSIDSVSSCFSNAPGGVPQPAKCSPGSTECATVTFLLHPPGRSPLRESAYTCANDAVCDNPQAVCKEISGMSPYEISDCSLTCCTSNNCNAPKEQKRPKLIKVIKDNFALRLFHSAVPQNAVASCYVSTTSSVSKKSCPSGATECLSVTFKVNPPGQPAEPGYGYGCANEIVCSSEGKKEVCSQAQSTFPFPVTDCVVTCCPTSNCNVPQQLQTIEIESFQLSLTPSIDQPTAGVTSCYVSTTSSVGPRSCPAGATECLSVNFDVNPPSHSPIPGSGYACANSYMCSSAGARQICSQASRSFPYPISNCKVTCCFTNNCNVPSQRRIIEI